MEYLIDELRNNGIRKVTRLNDYSMDRLFDPDRTYYIKISKKEDGFHLYEMIPVKIIQLDFGVSKYLTDIKCWIDFDRDKENWYMTIDGIKEKVSEISLVYPELLYSKKEDIFEKLPEDQIELIKKNLSDLNNYEYKIQCLPSLQEMKKLLDSPFFYYDNNIEIIESDTFKICSNSSETYILIEDRKLNIDIFSSVADAILISAGDVGRRYLSSILLTEEETDNGEQGIHEFEKKSNTIRRNLNDL